MSCQASGGANEAFFTKRFFYVTFSSLPPFLFLLLPHDVGRKVGRERRKKSGLICLKIFQLFLFESLPLGERGERKQEREDGDEFLHGKRIGRVCERKRGKLANRKKVPPNAQKKLQCNVHFFQHCPEIGFLAKMANFSL